MIFIQCFKIPLKYTGVNFSVSLSFLTSLDISSHPLDTKPFLSAILKQTCSLKHFANMTTKLNLLYYIEKLDDRDDIEYTPIPILLKLLSALKIGPRLPGDDLVECMTEVNWAKFAYIYILNFV